MKTVLLLANNQFSVDSFHRAAENLAFKLVVVDDQQSLFTFINSESVDAYIISNEFSYTQIACNTIKGINANVPFVAVHNNVYANQNFILGADVNYTTHPQKPDISAYGILHFIDFQLNLYSHLASFVPDEVNEIFFGEGYKYDVLYRTIYFNGIEIKRFSTKEGKILEVLARNYRTVVKRDAILEEVWHKTDIYSSRSFDVYTTKLRNFFREHDLKLKITNISGVGLILE